MYWDTHSGGHGQIRTDDTLVNSQLLWPTELRTHIIPWLPILLWYSDLWSSRASRKSFFYKGNYIKTSPSVVRGHAEIFRHEVLSTHPLLRSAQWWTHLVFSPQRGYTLTRTSSRPFYFFTHIKDHINNAPFYELFPLIGSHTKIVTRASSESSYATRTHNERFEFFPRSKPSIKFLVYRSLIYFTVLENVPKICGGPSWYRTKRVAMTAALQAAPSP